MVPSWPCGYLVHPSLCPSINYRLQSVLLFICHMFNSFRTSNGSLDDPVMLSHICHVLHCFQSVRPKQSLQYLKKHVAHPESRSYAPSKPARTIEWISRPPVCCYFGTCMFIGTFAWWCLFFTGSDF